MSVLNNFGGYKQLSASANCSPQQCNLLGIFVSGASNTPTLTVYDSATTGTGTKIIDTFTPTVGWNAMPISATAGLYVVVGGTVSCTVVYG